MKRWAILVNPSGIFRRVVHSGGKSVHGWFDVRKKSEAAVEKFFKYAVSLGADRATWTRSQFVRMPGGTRDNGKAQGILFFDAPRLARKRP